MRRRAYLTLAAVGAVAGCLGVGDDGSTEDDRTGDDTGSGSDTPDDGADDGSDDEQGRTGSDGSDDDSVSDGGDGSDDDGTDREVTFAVEWEETLDIDAAAGATYAATASEAGLFVGHGSGVTAFDLDGSRRWTDDQVAGFDDIAVAGDTLAVLTTEFELAAFDTDSGTMRWQMELDGADDLFTEPAVAATSDYVAAFDESGAIAVDAATGEHVTTGQTGEDLYATDGLLAVAHSVGGVVGIDPETGDQLYGRAFEHGLGSGGTVVGDRILAPVQTFEGPDEVVSVDIQTGQLLWQAEITDLSLLTEVGASEQVVAAYDRGDSETQLVGIDPTGGTRRWTASLGEVLTPFRPPAVDGNTVVADTEDGVAAFDAASGDRLGETDEPFITIAGLAYDDRFYDCGRNVTAYEL